MGKIVNVSESERKYLVRSFSKDSLWDREFIIYQWYDKIETERKIKLIIDLHSLTVKWVRVTKYRISTVESNKTIEYLSSEDVDLNELIGEQFVCKRRAVKGKISIDRFIRSKGNCHYLLEDEGDSQILEDFVASNNIILEDVTADVSFRNTNMTTSFTEDDKKQLVFLLDVLVFPKSEKTESFDTIVVSPTGNN